MAYIRLISSLPPTTTMVLTPSNSYRIKNVLNKCYVTYEGLIYTDDRIFARGPSDIKGRPGTTRGIIPYCSSFGPVENMAPQAVYLEKIGVNWAVLYSSSELATLLWCTIFIVYRILRVGGIAAGMCVHHWLVEMLVESAALYSAVIVVLEVHSEAAEITPKKLRSR
ncbi:hypothetical protein ARMGADRAFT_1082786 [Armillaria gallica]|uniref:Uncharacterized protein n=1 Tax=Armillaria gallica TaxID=47427 RepID=A0A2H3D8V0_ARMGA|nr:hypothetical protein ARMGADRAFT_1082786 [Armillaria gallica]